MVDSKERIWVADTIAGSVFVFDKQNKSLQLLGTESAGKMISAFGVALDSHDNIRVSDIRQKQINVHNAECGRSSKAVWSG